MEIRFRAIAEDDPGPRWRKLCRSLWPHYEEWFLREGDAHRPGYLQCRRMLRRHLPELVPTWERLCELGGGGDRIARMLSLYRPTPYLSGCSQVALTRTEPLLVRNYDYHPLRCEGTILRSAWHGTRVIAMSDCLWGVLDGMNEHGLAVSLAFGGRQDVGDGFGIPLILRYVLEFCRTTPEAVEVLERVPSHMAYNVTVVDGDAAWATVHVGPGRASVKVPTPFSTNHQAEIAWPEHAAATRTHDREDRLAELVDGNSAVVGADVGAAAVVRAFLRPPLFQRGYERAFGTLYTAAYRARAGEVEYLWPSRSWRQSFESFDEGEMLVRYRPG